MSSTRVADEATLPGYQHVSVRTVVAFLSDNTRQTATLSSGRVTRHPNGISSVTFTGGTPFRPVVPVSRDTLIASASSDTGFAFALTRHFVALTAVRSNSAIARFATVTRIVAIVIVRATITLLSDYVLATEALS